MTSSIGVIVDASGRCIGSLEWSRLSSNASSEIRHFPLNDWKSHLGGLSSDGANG